MPNIGTKEEQQMYEMLQDLWGRIESVDDVFEEVSGYMNGMRSAQAENEALRNDNRRLLELVEFEPDINSALAANNKEGK